LAFRCHAHAEFTDSHERVSGHMMLESAERVMRR
jgi:hypothetical protein